MRRSETSPNATSGAHRATAEAELMRLEADNHRLQARLAALTEEVGRNDSLLRKTQERELELLRAGSLTQLFERLIVGLRTSYQLDEVALILHDPQHEIRHLLSGDGVTPNEPAGVCFVDALVSIAPQLATLERPWLGPYRKADHELLVPGVSAPPGSLALIPMRRSEPLDGVLVFSSTDPRRFTPELGSDFLAHLGLVAAICVENAVNRARLLRSGLTDFLTGFHNRRYLHARLREELSRAQRSRHSIICLMIDVDHFKRINDQYGHLAGDAVLREVAQRIDAEMRLSDTGARFGGDEFAMVLSQAAMSDGEKVAARVLHAVRAEPIAVGRGKMETVTLSIGVAAAKPGPGQRDYKVLAERLIAEADAALYRAKSAGRNRVAISPNVVA
ncbi:MAG: sensor domain-containing diguanylate cyclase [Gammaproteobacteria bacterium]|nr:sensor domain-containing diguanylate cyclase [Gammaproteobacteria bacterium]MBV8403250.1 sensor domain-containing diguanylate cyclase [Gammaproteobacteria bacterium]